VTKPGAATPPTWAVHGQPLAVAQLRADLEAGRLAHAYLLTGPESVGKATLARRLAQAIHCEAPQNGVDPCLECRGCRRVEDGEAPDVDIVAIGGPCSEESHRDHVADGSTRIRICQARRITRLSSLAPFHIPPHHPPRRIFVVDTADDLQTEAGHALLKTLEEPPGSSLLILLATDPDELLPTIRSRCREIALRPMPRPQLAAALEAGLGLDPEEATRLATLARGRYGLAVRLHEDPSLSQLRRTAAEDVARLAAAGRNERFDYAAKLAGGWRRERQSVLETLDVWRWWWRDALARSAGLDVGEPDPDAGAEPPACSTAEAATALRATQRARQHLLENTNPQLALEVLMLDLPQLASPDTVPNGEEARAAAAPAP
jgi:DNA polymerase-3 subunit delta'